MNRLNYSHFKMGHQVGNGIDIVKIKQKSLICKLKSGKSCFSISVSDTD